MWEGRREPQTKAPSLPLLLSEVALNKSGLDPRCLCSAESLSKALRQACKFLKRPNFRANLCSQAGFFVHLSLKHVTAHELTLEALLSTGRTDASCGTSAKNSVFLLELSGENTIPEPQKKPSLLRCANEWVHTVFLLKVNSSRDRKLRAETSASTQEIKSELLLGWDAEREESAAAAEESVTMLPDRILLSRLHGMTRL